MSAWLIAGYGQRFPRVGSTPSSKRPRLAVSGCSWGYAVSVKSGIEPAPRAVYHERLRDAFLPLVLWSLQTSTFNGVGLRNQETVGCGDSLRDKDRVFHTRQEPLSSV